MSLSFCIILFPFNFFPAEVQVAGEVQEVKEGVEAAAERERSDVEEEAAENDEDEERAAHQSVKALNWYFPIFWLTFNKKEKEKLLLISKIIIGGKFSDLS